MGKFINRIDSKEEYIGIRLQASEKLRAISLARRLAGGNVSRLFRQLVNNATDKAALASGQEKAAVG